MTGDAFALLLAEDLYVLNRDVDRARKAGFKVVLTLDEAGVRLAIYRSLTVSPEKLAELHAVHVSVMEHPPNAEASQTQSSPIRGLMNERTSDHPLPHEADRGQGSV